MGSFHKLPSFPHDLKVTILSSSTLYPPTPTERRSMLLSNIDQVLNFGVETVHFFEANADFSVDAVADRLRSALERLLVPYDFLAGRLRFDAEGGRLEIDCNAAGVGFFVASSGLELAELGELEYPNAAFRQLAPAAKPADGLGVDDHPLCAFQVTSFKCGGFALGIYTNHSTFDGISFQIFLKNLAAAAFNKPLPIPPHNNRHLLAARSPPYVAFPHRELFELNLQPNLLSHEANKQLPNPPSIIDKFPIEDLKFKLFHLSTNDISFLKEKAKAEGDDRLDPTVATSFNVVIAHLWRCKALATNGDGDGDRDKTSTVLYAVDIRRRLSPNLPPSYTGNAVLSAYATARCQDLETDTFSKIVTAVREGAVRMTDEYARSVIDWGQLHKGFPKGDLFVSSWWKLGFAEVEYPWGKPKYSCPVADPKSDIVLLFPSIGGADRGVNVLVSLPGGSMEKFQSLFYRFLE